MTDVLETIAGLTEITDIGVLDGAPPGLTISVAGVVGAPGWRAPRLVPRHHDRPPGDGLHEFDFLALPPARAETQHPVPITAEGMLFPLPDWVRGVRIHARAGTLTRRFSTRRPAMVEADLSDLEPGQPGFCPVSARLPGAAALLPGPELSAPFPRRIGQRSADFLLLTLRGLSEIRTEWEERPALRTRGAAAILTARQPVLFRRQVTMRLTARVCFADDARVAGAVEAALRGALASGLLMDAVSAPLTALATDLGACLADRLRGEHPDCAELVSVQMIRDKRPGPWRRV